MLCLKEEEEEEEEEEDGENLYCLVVHMRSGGARNLVFVVPKKQQLKSKTASWENKTKQKQKQYKIKTKNKNKKVYIYIYI